MPSLSPKLGPSSAPTSPSDLADRGRPRSGSSCGVLGFAAQSMLSVSGPTSSAALSAASSRNSSRRLGSSDDPLSPSSLSGVGREVVASGSAAADCDSVTNLLVNSAITVNLQESKPLPRDGPSVQPTSNADVDLPVSRRRLFAPAKSSFTKKILTIDNMIHDMMEDDKKCHDKCQLSHVKHPAQDVSTPGAMCSIWGSMTTSKDSYIPFFADKPMNFDGELSDQVPHYIGLLCHRGLKPKAPNQDDYFVLAREGMLLFGVFDGHGQEGHEISNFGVQHMPKFFMERLQKDRESWEDIAKSSFADVMERMVADLGRETPNSAGSTATICMLDTSSDAEASAGAPPEDSAGAASSSLPLRLRCAFVGDSSTVYAKRKQGSRNWDVTLLTDIHKPDRPDELERIEAHGGCVQPNAHSVDLPSRFVCGDFKLSMSRALGDLHFAPFGLIHEPEITPEIEMTDDYEHLIITASDGIWDMVPPAQAVQLVGKYKPEEAQLAVEKLVSKATLRWQEREGGCVDDITCILVWPQF